MLCEHCKQKQAEFNVIHSINGYKKTMRLCRECSQKFQQSQTTDLLNGFLSAFSGMQQPVRTKVHVCPACKTTSEEVLRTGYVGCPQCYREFQSLLKPYIERSQYKMDHTGKSPLSEKEKEYKSMLRELDAAKNEERYEDAAAIKRKINQFLAEEGQQ